MNLATRAKFTAASGTSSATYTFYYAGSTKDFTDAVINMTSWNYFGAFVMNTDPTVSCLTFTISEY